MKRGKIALVAVAACAALGMVAYALSVTDEAATSFDVALLVFAVLAAVVTCLDVVVSVMSYRRELARVPRPSLQMQLPDGSTGGHLRLEVQITEPANEFDALIERRRAQLEQQLERSRGSVGLVASSFFTLPDSAVKGYRDEVEVHLRKYGDYLERKALWDSIWRRSYVTVLVFENNRAGVPASGVRVQLHFPEEEEGVRVFSYRDMPDPPAEPEAPTPPKPADLSRLVLAPSLYRPPIPSMPSVDLSAIERRGNVSGPRFGKGSVLVTYEVEELLHNTVESTEHDPLVVSFLRAGTWEVPYEIHARNLPSPVRGKLVIEAALTDEPPSYEPPRNDEDGE